MKNLFYHRYVLMKKALGIITASATYLSFALPALAQGRGGSVKVCPSGGSFGSTLCNINDLGKLVGTAVSVLLIIAVIVSLFYLVFGGIRWVTSGGDKAKVESARNHIIAAIIGLVVAFLAFFILNDVLSLFGLNINSLKLPTITGAAQG
jgi:hypothetical protein